MVFGERHSIYGNNGAIRYITHLDKFSYFPKHYNFHEISVDNGQYTRSNSYRKLIFLCIIECILSSIVRSLYYIATVYK